MEVDEPAPEIKSDQAPEEKVGKSKNDLPKIDAFIKFKTPTEKQKQSPKKRKVETTHPKTPVKVDLLEETAMSSWSDNSNSDLIKPNNKKSDDAQIIVLEDSSDIKLFYEESENSTMESKNNSTSQNSKGITSKTSDTLNETTKVDNASLKNKSIEENILPKNKITDNLKVSPKNKTLTVSKQTIPSINTDFLKQAKVTDIKEANSVKPAPSPKAPRRVSFVTLSSPKNKKSC